MPKEVKPVLKTRTPKPIDRWLGIFATVVAILLYLLPKTKLTIIGCCTVIGALAIHPIIKFWWIEDRKWRQLAAFIVLTFGLILLGYRIPPDVKWGTSPTNIADSSDTAGLSNTSATSPLAAKQVSGKQKNNDFLRNAPNAEDAKALQPILDTEEQVRNMPPAQLRIFANRLAKDLTTFGMGWAQRAVWPEITPPSDLVGNEPENLKREHNKQVKIYFHELDKQNEEKLKWPTDRATAFQKQFPNNAAAISATVDQLAKICNDKGIKVDAPPDRYGPDNAIDLSQWISMAARKCLN